MYHEDLLKELKSSGKWFFDVFENNTIGMILTDLETSRYQFVNKAFLHDSGYSLNEILDKTALELNLLDPAFRKENLKVLNEKGSLKNIELLVRRKNGESFWAMVSVQTFLLNGKRYALSSFIDITERKRSEAELALFESIVRATDDAIISKSIDSFITSWNRGAEKMFGYKAEEVTGKNISLIIPAEYIEEEAAMLKRLLNHEPVEHYETVRIRKDHTRINVALTISPIRDEAGTITGFCKVARDITDQKKDSYARNLIEASLDPLITISAEGKITDVNEASVNITGISREKLKGTDFSDYFTEPVKAQEGYQQVFLKGFVSDYPLTIRHRKGMLTDVLYNASLYKDNKGNVLGIFAAARDITSQRQTAHYARSLIEASLDPLVTIDPSGDIMDVNEAMIKATDRPREKLIGTNISVYFIEALKARQVCEKVFAEGYIMNYPLTIIDGVLTDVLLNGSVYRDEQGEIIGAVMVARDITELKRIEKELTEAKVFAELALTIAEDQKIKAEDASHIAEDAVKAKQQFLSNMSHEIRTPMNAIIGFTKVLLKTDFTESQKQYLMAIKMSGDALIVLINDILDLAKVDSGKMNFEQTPFKLASSISAMLHLFETKILEKNLGLLKEYDESIPAVLIGDPVRLHQVIMNLLSNAVKFTAKGKITVCVKMVSEKEDEVQVEFSVKDTGIGIAENKLGKIFENFQQASSGTSRLYGGTGLGLAIVKQLVEPQGGHIHVTSELGVGSTFGFTLPFKKTTEEAAPETELLLPDDSFGNVRVLVVEDIALNQLLMKTLLDDFGFTGDIANNGKVAVELLQHHTYDVILMDLQMPEMNGFEATEFIRTKLQLQIPIIALTADVTTTDLAKCKSVGMNDYIAKPVDEKLLYTKIVALVKKTGQQKPGRETWNNADMDKQLRYTDLDYLNLRTKSNPKLMKEMIALYLEQTPPLISAMKLSFRDKDWKSLYSAVHKMIPSFAIMGISIDFENMAKKIQEFASTQLDQDGMPALVLQVENVCNQACRELEIEFNRIKTDNS